jgi:signal transduction histidine kinase
MDNAMPITRLDERAQRWQPVMAVVPYLLLLVLMIFTVVIKHSTGGSPVGDVVLCALAGGWMLFWFTSRPAWRMRTGIMAVFFVGLIVIIAVLVLRDGWFGFLTPIGYYYAFGVLRWPWQMVGVGAVAVVAGTAQASGVDKGTAFGIAVLVAVILANVLPMCGFAWINWSNDVQYDERAVALSELSEANRRLEATLAENAGLHEQLLTQAREAGVLDERARMAREIHDTLAQGLTGIITQLQAAEQAGDDPGRWRRHVSAATGLARESLTEARRSVDALRPQPLETDRLSDALAGVAERWSALHGITVRVTTTGTVRPMRPDAEFALLRTAQEALANVAEHARATRVGVTLSYMEHEVALDVRDDGTGFVPVPRSRTTEKGGGFGLIAMRERIEGLAGTLQVESEPGAGTAISACVPAEAHA